MITALIIVLVAILGFIYGAISMILFLKYWIPKGNMPAFLKDLGFELPEKFSNRPDKSSGGDNG